MQKSNRKRKLQKKARENRKNINGNTITLKGGYVPVAMDQSEYYEHLQKSRVGTGTHKDKRKKLLEKARSKDRNFEYA